MFNFNLLYCWIDHTHALTVNIELEPPRCAEEELEAESEQPARLEYTNLLFWLTN